MRPLTHQGDTEYDQLPGELPEVWADDWPQVWPEELPDVSGSEAGVTIRYWASARAAAGCDSERFTGRCVEDVLAAAAAAHTGLGVILQASTILLDGRPATGSQPLPDGTTIEVLPPFAGG